MSKKNILGESATRRMMKMANIGKFADDFINESEELEEGEELEEDESLEEESLDEMDKVDHSHPDQTFKPHTPGKLNHLEEGMPPMDDEDPMANGDMPMDDAPMDDPMDDMGMDMDMGPEEPATVEGLIDAIVTAIETSAPGYLEVASEEPMGDPMAPPEDDLGMEDPMGDLGDEEIAEAGPRLKGATREVPMEESTDAKINEIASYIARQVKHRLNSK
jgi:hypothetical protein